MGRLTARQVDVLLELAAAVVVATGVSSLAVGTSWARALTAVHAIAGLTLLVLAPAKARGSVRVGLRRRRISRWLSLGLAALLLTTIGLGFVHSTGLSYGVGYWSPLWTHVLVAFGVVALLLWHVVSRPDRPGLVDLDRRAVLRGGGAVAVAATAYGAQELAVRTFGLAGSDRRFTGSHEVASFDPDRMPSVSWINDEPPTSTDPTDWDLDVAGERVSIQQLQQRSTPILATVDCTGGWYSTQRWDAVELSDLLGDRRARSIDIRSSTGYSRLFPYRDRHRLYLAVGYDGSPLRRDHGAPVRLVAPGRRGPWWIKWVTSVQLDDRPWWLQLPFPLE